MSRSGRSSADSSRSGRLLPGSPALGVSSVSAASSALAVCLVLAVCLILGVALAPSAVASTASVAGSPTDATTTDLATADDHGSVEREGQTVVLEVPAERVDAGESVELTVEIDEIAANDSRLGSQSVAPRSTVTASRSGDRYVAEVAVTELVAPDVTADLSSATIRASSDGAVVLEDDADLRYLARAGSDGFDDTTLTVAVDARGLGTDDATVALDDGSRLEATVDGVGPDASLRVPAAELDGVGLAPTYEAAVLVDDSRVPGPSIALSVGDAVRTATTLGYREGESVLVLPVLHRAIGPQQVTVSVRTNAPAGHYEFEGSDERGYRDAPAGIAAASIRRLTVSGGGQTVLSGHDLPVPARDSVTFQVYDGAFNTTEPSALEPYDALLVRTPETGVVRVPIDQRLRAGQYSRFPPSVGQALSDDPGELTATGLLVGSDVRPAMVNFERAPDEEPTVPSAETDPNADEFVAIWIDVADGVVLLVLAMLGSFAAVTAVFVVRLFRPAGSPSPGLGGALLHFALGGVAGTAAVTAVQRATLGTLLDTVAVGGVEIGLGALLVGGFYGGLVSTAIRVGLGTSGLWPTRYAAGGQTIPVRVRLTDDGGGAIPGEQTVEVQRPGTGRVLRRVTVADAATELELTPGHYGFVARTGERETDPKSVRLPEPERTLPETRDVHLTVARPGLQVEVRDGQTGDPIDGASVTVTTDSERTKSETATEGSARLALPIETGTVSITVDAEGYERTTVEAPIDQQLLTIDVDVPPEGGTLVATALVDGEPLPGARVRVAPRNDEQSSAAGESSDHASADDEPSDSPQSSAGQQSSIGRRSAMLETDADGRAETRLPVGAYGLRLELHGPTAHLFETKPTAVAVEAGERVETTVHARFTWTPSEEVRERTDGLRDTIRSVATQATSDPTIPLYFAGVATALLDVVDDLPAEGHRFATATTEPNPVAAVAVDAAQATLSAVGRAMQSEGVQPVLGSGADPVHIEPDVAASPESLLAHLTEDEDIGTVEARAQRVRERIDREEAQLATVAPARAIVAVAVDLQNGADVPIQVAGRQYAALRLLEAAEELFEREELRERLGGDAGE